MATHVVKYKKAPKKLNGLTIDIYLYKKYRIGKRSVSNNFEY